MVAPTFDTKIDHKNNNKNGESLFDHEQVAYAPKKGGNNKQNENDDNENDDNDNMDGRSGGTGLAKSAYHFRGFDPNKILGKKKGHNSFKSKSKYKRR